jgi:hypothetical protein
MKKSEFERRAAEMKARNLARGKRPAGRLDHYSLQIASLPSTPLVKVYVRDFLSEADFQRLSPPLSAIRKLGHVETDSDGLLDFRHAGLNIAVSPDQFVRGIEIYDAVLKAAATQGWTAKQAEESPLRIVVDGEPLELAVAEKTEPIHGSPTPVGAKAPRWPTGALSVALSVGERKVYVSDKRGRRIESKLPSLFAKAETLASDIRAEHEKQAELRREHEMDLRRRYEVHERIEQLNQDVDLMAGG